MSLAKIIHIDPLRRVDPQLRVQLEHYPDLSAQGWERRFTADERRTQEAVELYTEMGLEVRAEPVRTKELDDNCKRCRSVIQFYTIYTRPKS
jgi:hypothetical protein